MAGQKVLFCLKETFRKHLFKCTIESLFTNGSVHLVHKDQLCFYCLANKFNIVFNYNEIIHCLVSLVGRRTNMVV